MSQPRSTNTYIIPYFCTHNKSQGLATYLSYHLIVCLSLVLLTSLYTTLVMCVKVIEEKLYIFSYALKE